LKSLGISEDSRMYGAIVYKPPFGCGYLFVPYCFPPLCYKEHRHAFYMYFINIIIIITNIIILIWFDFVLFMACVQYT